MEAENLEAEKFREKVISLLSACYASSKFVTKQEFAQDLGTNYLQLYRWMEGKTIPRKESLKKICDVCHVDFLTFMSLESGGEFPHKILNLANLTKAYIKADVSGDCADGELIIALASTIVYTQLLYLGANLTIETECMSTPQRAVTALPTTRGSISFLDPQLFDLHIVIYGSTSGLTLNVIPT